jgi:thiol:disulfide interchange protein/DsbC/DsbD-like thiol-disulfide interchange protein
MVAAAVTALMIGLAASTAAGAAAATIATDHIEARVVPRADIVAPGDRLELALVQHIADGWHTYWENPGDSGEPFHIEWGLPPGSKAGEVRWPTPELVPYPPLMNYGYTGTTTAILSVVVPEEWPVGTPFPVDIEVTWLVCEEICIPETGSASFSVSTGAESRIDSLEAFTFVEAEQAMPKKVAWPATLEPTGDGGVLTFDTDGIDLQGAESAYFFPRPWGVINPAAPQRAMVDGARLALAFPQASLQVPDQIDGILKIRFANKGGKGYLVEVVGANAAQPLASAGAPHSTSDSGAATLSGQGFASTDDTLPTISSSEASPTVSLAPAETGSSIVVPSYAAATRSDAFGIFDALIFALLGGLILNLMPCVFPVLALKTAALAGQASHKPAERAAHGALYAGGVLVAFMVLAGGLIALKAAGAAVGWGFQLQNPLFVAILAYVIFAVGLNLSGVYEIGARLGGIGSALTARSGPGGSFATGVLAVILASPCSAPFMAASIGFALTQGPGVTLAIFAALGLGLALPFLLVSLVPGAARLLPKPGVWMLRLRQVLAFPMYATAAWLIWVLVQQTSVDAVFAVLVGLVLVAFALWLFGLVQYGELKSRRPALAVAAVGALAAVALLVPSATTAFPTAGAPGQLRPGPGEPGTAAAGTLAEQVAFSPARLEGLRREGRQVFLNVTAAWCITCKVNERVVFAGEDFRDLLEATGATYMVADWTRRDADISALLEGFGRAGVPLYVVFPANGGTPKVLPQILTEGILREALSGRA